MAFSYDSIPQNEATELQDIETTVKGNMYGGVELCLKMGNVLIRAKEMLGHGKFMDWIEARFKQEFELSIDTAERWMGLARNPELVQLPFPLSVKYELIDCPPCVIPLLLAENETKRVTVEETRRVVQSTKLRMQVEAHVEAMKGAAPSENMERTAMKVLEMIQDGFDSQKCRDEAKLLWQEYGEKLNAWANVIDNDMMATNRLLAPVTPGNGNGSVVWTSLEEFEHGGWSVVVHVPLVIPNTEHRYANYTIATFPDVQLKDDKRAVSAFNLQCAFLAGGAKSIGLSVPNLEEE